MILPHEAGNPDYALQLADKRMYAARSTAGHRGSPREQAHNVLRHIMRAKQPEPLPIILGPASPGSRSPVGLRLGMSSEELDELARARPSCTTLERSGIPDAILKKPGPLKG